MHVAIITTSYPDNVPGSEAAGSFVADFAQQLSEDVRVTVIAAASNSSERREGKVDVTRFAVPRMPLSLLRPLNPADWPAIVRTVRSGTKAVEAVVRDRQPSYLFALWALPSGHWAAAASRQTDVSFGIWALGSDIWSLGRIPLLRGKLRRVLRAADHCFADGLRLADDVERLAGRKCDFLASTRALPTPAQAGIAESGPYKLAFLGRWHLNKGVDTLLAALLQLTDEDWHRISCLRIHGGGPLHDEVQQAAIRLRDLGRPIEVGGYLGKKGAADLIAWADYLLLPSRIESIPVIFSDAVQLQTPIVSTPVGDLPALHEKYDFGVLAADTSAGAFLHAMRAALRENSSIFRAGLIAAAGDFDPVDIARKFVAEIESPVR